MSILLPHPISQKEALETIANFFDLAVTGKEMTRLTNAPASVLSRISQGDESDRHWPHIARVAAFCNELREALADMTGNTLPNQSMKGWLYGGKVQTTRHGVQTPWAALADPEMAQEALHELRRAVGTL